MLRNILIEHDRTTDQIDQGMRVRCQTEDSSLVSWVHLSTIREMVEEVVCWEVDVVWFGGRGKDRTHKQRGSQIEARVL